MVSLSLPSLSVPYRFHRPLVCMESEGYPTFPFSVCKFLSLIVDFVQVVLIWLLAPFLPFRSFLIVRLSHPPALPHAPPLHRSRGQGSVNLRRGVYLTPLKNGIACLLYCFFGVCNRRIIQSLLVYSIPIATKNLCIHLYLCRLIYLILSV